MFNEIWPAPTWGSVDYAGRYKFLHYAARRFYAPLMINAYEINDIFKVFVNSDINNDLGKIVIEIRSFSYASKQPFQTITREIQMGPLGNVLVYNSSDIVKDLLMGRSRNECILSLRVLNQTNVYNEYYLSIPKDIKNLQKPDIKIFNMTKTATGFEFVLLSDYVAPFVFMEIDEEIFGLFDDNAFTLWPGENKRMVYECRRGKCEISADRFMKLLLIRTLYHSY